MEALYPKNPDINRKHFPYGWDQSHCQKKIVNINALLFPILDMTD